MRGVRQRGLPAELVFRRPPAQVGRSLARLPLNMGKNCPLPPHSGIDRVAPCLVSPKTNSPSPAERLVHASV